MSSNEKILSAAAEDGLNLTLFDIPFLTISYFLLPARASEQGNVIGLVSVYIIICSCHKFFFVIEQTRDLIYLKFVATDFFPKIMSPSAGENSGDLA